MLDLLTVLRRKKQCKCSITNAKAYTKVRDCPVHGDAAMRRIYKSWGNNGPTT